MGYFHGVMQHSPLHDSAGSSLLKPGASRINGEVPSGCSENTVEGGWFLTAARLLPPSTPIASSIPAPCCHTSSPAAEDLPTAHHVFLMLGGANRLRRALLRGSKRAIKMEKIIGERERKLLEVLMHGFRLLCKPMGTGSPGAAQALPHTWHGEMQVKIEDGKHGRPETALNCI